MSYTVKKHYDSYAYGGQSVQFCVDDYKSVEEGKTTAQYRKIHLYQGYKDANGCVGDTLWVKVLDKDLDRFDGGCTDGLVVVMLQNDPVVATRCNQHRLRYGTLLPVSSGIRDLYGDDMPVCDVMLMSPHNEVHTVPSKCNDSALHAAALHDIAFMQTLTQLAANIERRKLPKDSTANDDKQDI